jgi:hypothetical protein
MMTTVMNSHVNNSSPMMAMSCVDFFIREWLSAGRREARDMRSR